MRLFFIYSILLSLSISQNVTAVKAETAPVIDGIIEEKWHNYVKFTEFKQRWPALHADATVKSEVFFTYDEENVYVAAKFYQDKSTIKGTRYRRDNQELWNDDWFQFNFDPFNKGNNGFYIGLNPANALIDGKLGPNGQEDNSWNGIITTATYIGDDFWSAEAKFPLSTLDFQSQDRQTWAMTFGRNYSQKQEQIWIHDIPTDDHLRLTSYAKVNDLMNLRIGEPYKAAPYIYSENLNDSFNNETNGDVKVGLDFRYQPNPSTSIIVTANPDFAQIESDRDIINVSDSPTFFPEKRPFFTNNSEFYGPAPGVRTRNINEIDVGLKFVQEAGKLKYDITAILEKENNQNWLMGDFIYTNSTDYKFELIGGLLDRDNTVFNTVLSVNYYTLDRTLTFYSFIEANNVIKTYVGTRSGINYRTREWNASAYIDAKPPGYNSGEVGFFLISNRMDIGGRISRNWNFDENFIRSTNIQMNFDRNSLHSHFEESWRSLRLSSFTQFNMGRSLGLWRFYFQYSPDVGDKFRYRSDTGTFYDNISRFDLVKQNSDYIRIFTGTDSGRSFSVDLNYNNRPIRQSNANNYGISFVFKPIEEIRLLYSFNTIDIEGSPFQNSFEQKVHRIKLDYNVTDRFNIRSIFNINNFLLPADEEIDEFGNPTGIIGYEFNEPSINLTAAWEYEPGSFAYLVLNRFQAEGGYGNILVNTKKFSSIVVKFSKNFQF